MSDDDRRARGNGTGAHGAATRALLLLALVASAASPAVAGHAGRVGASPFQITLNGLGGTPLVELYVAYNDVAKQVAALGGRISRTLVGNYITSLDMAGCSITLLQADDELLSLWDDPVLTPALRWGV